ncbi:MAG: PPOX class F420-dependent oxidoreductase [Acidimicrobiia bacterium]|nr:PPOX class F420-dependent oxidoreductase [Acidimicrobiia bacterium]
MTDIAVPESHADLLALAIAPAMATIGPGGEPQCSPVWFEWERGVIRVSLTTQRQKYRNLVERPRVALAFVDPDDMYRSMELRGTTTSIEPDIDNALLNRLAKRYLGIDAYTFDADGTERVVVSVTPSHVTTWQ